MALVDQLKRLDGLLQRGSAWLNPGFGQLMENIHGHLIESGWADKYKKDFDFVVYYGNLQGSFIQLYVEYLVSGEILLILSKFSPDEVGVNINKQIRVSDLTDFISVNRLNDPVSLFLSIYPSAHIQPNHETGQPTTIMQCLPGWTYLTCTPEHVQMEKIIGSVGFLLEINKMNSGSGYMVRLTRLETVFGSDWGGFVERNLMHLK